MAFGRAAATSKSTETKPVDKWQVTMLFAIILTIACFCVAYVEGVLESFYAKFGPPFTVGSVIIASWHRFCLYVTLLIFYQIFNVIMQETFGRKFEREHLQQKKWKGDEVIMLSIYNMYRWCGTVLHILVASTRFDIWLILALVDTVTRAIIWFNPKSNGRVPRIFSL
tara:strand:+ start:2233 stop:2736 length:504 start_codon:yes stop_codon:yes gene_type:complete